MQERDKNLYQFMKKQKQQTKSTIVLENEQGVPMDTQEQKQLQVDRLWESVYPRQYWHNGAPQCDFPHYDPDGFETELATRDITVNEVKNHFVC